MLRGSTVADDDDIGVTSLTSFTGGSGLTIGRLIDTAAGGEAIYEEE